MMAAREGLAQRGASPEVAVFVEALLNDQARLGRQRVAQEAEARRALQQYVTQLEVRVFNGQRL